MNQQPGLLHPSLPCSGPCRPSNGQWQHGRGGSLPRWPTQDDSEEGKSWCHSGKKKSGNRKPRRNSLSKNVMVSIWEPQSKLYLGVHFGLNSFGCSTSFVNNIKNALHNHASGSWDTHLFVTKSVTSPGSPDRCHGVGSAKLGEGPKQGSQLKSLEILQHNKSIPTNETNEEMNC